MSIFLIKYLPIKYKKISNFLNFYVKFPKNLGNLTYGNFDNILLKCLKIIKNKINL